jgi:mono/diheme cytochrome c family protein
MTPVAPRPKRSKTPQLLALCILGAAGFLALIHFGLDAIERRAASRVPNPVPATVAAIAAGHHTYDVHCASCHGSNGDGKGERAANLWSKPTNFRDPAATQSQTDGELFYVTSKGDWPMPEFQSKLSDAERWQVIDYLRTFAQVAPDAH